MLDMYSTSLNKEPVGFNKGSPATKQYIPLLLYGSVRFDQAGNYTRARTA